MLSKLVSKEKADPVGYGMAVLLDEQQIPMNVVSRSL